MKPHLYFHLIVILGLLVVPRIGSGNQVLLSAPSAGSSYYGMYSPYDTAAAFTLTNSCYVSTIDVTLYTPAGTSFTNFDFSLQSSLTNPISVFASQNLTAAVGVSTQVMNVNVTLAAGAYYLTSLVPGYFGTTVTPGDVDGWEMSTGSYIQTAGTIANGVWAGNPPAFDTGGVYVAPAFTVNGILIPRVAIVLSGGNVLVTWPTNTAGYTLQSTTNLSPAVWSTISNAPAVVNGQNTVTNPISGLQKFYRLSQ